MYEYGCHSLATLFLKSRVLFAFEFVSDFGWNMYFGHGDVVELAISIIDEDKCCRSRDQSIPTPREQTIFYASSHSIYENYF